MHSKLFSAWQFDLFHKPDGEQNALPEITGHGNKFFCILSVNSSVDNVWEALRGQR